MNILFISEIVTSPLSSPITERRAMGSNIYGDPTMQPGPQHLQQQILTLKQQQQLQQQMLLQQFQQQQQQLAQEHEKQLQDYHKVSLFQVIVIIDYIELLPFYFCDASITSLGTYLFMKDVTVLLYLV